MARMLGDVAQSWCKFCGHDPGPDCPDTGRGSRTVKRREQRGILADWAAELDEDYRHALLPPYDAVDCLHGCGGGRLCAAPCNFTCHDNRCENCTAPALHWLDTGWFCSYDCYGEYGRELVMYGC